MRQKVVGLFLSVLLVLGGASAASAEDTDMKAQVNTALDAIQDAGTTAAEVTAEKAHALDRWLRDLSDTAGAAVNDAADQAQNSETLDHISQETAAATENFGGMLQNAWVAFTGAIGIGETDEYGDDTEKDD